ncbi:SDR family oxidoreductase [Paenibacillus taichungensis]|uniref:NAD(P)-binding oxidoreductase n=1 Tax=Paenibacillus taichungensis TaxID=484184 RepID=UPI002DBE117C|nr:NAD(P)-binding oxidoreductase [Paenibacillus taichungensis]MEC0111213.1 SDR family oxidoreductase [Paenibacillus taichungensis]MEC0200876.1 SDR family oxidoreductase [Paenibacillus taichungensis]
MNILIVGANGGIGREVIQKLKESKKYNPIAGVRNQEQVEQFEKEGVPARVVDIRKTVTQIAQQLDHVDAIVFTAGGGSSMLVDFDGKVKTAKAAEQVGIKRFVLISAGGIHHFHDDSRLEWMNDYEEYSAAMYYSDMWVEHSTLDYTIIRPGHLTSETGTGYVRVGEYLPHENISRKDVAEVVITVLDNDQTVGQAFDVINGNSPIRETINQLKAGTNQII